MTIVVDGETVTNNEAEVEVAVKLDGSETEASGKRRRVYVETPLRPNSTSLTCQTRPEVADRSTFDHCNFFLAILVDHALLRSKASV